MVPTRQNASHDISIDGQTEGQRDLLRDPWTFLIMREALSGVSRFADFRDNLAIATDVLTERLNRLVEAGVLRRADYKEPGHRTLTSYPLTEAGAELKIVIGALQQWGDAYLPVACGPTIERRDGRTGEALTVGFVNARGRRVALDQADFVRTAAYPN